MERPDPTSIPWFTVFMGLSNSGLVPTVTPTEYMPNRRQLAEFWGPKYGSGYTFDNHGSKEYECYVRELFRRVYQVQWPISNVLPFHMARGLLAEAMHMEVNWSEFAYKVTHPHQSHSRGFRLHPEFADLVFPLEPLVKVIPTTALQADEELPDLSHLFVSPTLNPITMPQVVNTPIPPSTSSNPGIVAPKQEPFYRSSLSRSGRTSAGFPIVGAGAYAGFSYLRNKFAAVVDTEMAKLKQERHDTGSDMTRCVERLNEEKDRIKWMSRQLKEKRDSYDKATEEYEKARGVLAAARGDLGDSDSCIGPAQRKGYLKNCEALVHSWTVNTEIIRQRLSAWEFRHNRQVTLIAKLQSDLEAAEALYADNIINIDSEVENLQAVSDLLKQL